MTGRIKKILVVLFLFTTIAVTVLWYHTASDMQTVPDQLSDVTRELKKIQLTDRYGEALTVTYQNRWNTALHLAGHEIPEKLQQIMVLSEDKRFYDHGGVDWFARLHALWQNLISGKGVRGASTISEQVIRMLHIRPRTVWSRWVEGFEAYSLENKNNKSEILEFYMNQVPYASNRRGVGQASAFYFNRSVDTLSLKEMVALAVLVRAPSYYDLYRNPGNIDASLNRFAMALFNKKFLSEEEYNQILSDKFELENPKLNIKAEHFAGYVYKNSPEIILAGKKKLKTTLDGNLQVKVTSLLQKTINHLKKHNVINGACLVSDHTTGEILAWVSATGDEDIAAGRDINSVLVRRQPGSSLKPFLYSLAIEKGWTAATLINDNSLINPVGKGLHTYHNYSRRHYGNVSLRQALGNSLNIPAVKAIRFTGVDEYLGILRKAGIKSLSRQSDFYGDGLALGNGEITLFELVQAFNVLADKGRFKPLIYTKDGGMTGEYINVFSKEVTSIIGNILSDSEARGLEFGSGSILNFPVQTALKTGTSSDYRDAWAVGFNHKYTAGVWMGNLDGRAMDGITGSKGPAMVLRSVFAELNKHEESKPLYLSPELIQKEICLDNEYEGSGCISGTEYFIPGTEPLKKKKIIKKERIGFLKPTNGLEMALDPRIPDKHEAFEFVVTGVDDSDSVNWKLNGQSLGKTKGGRYLWNLKRGRHIVEIEISKKGFDKIIIDKVSFTVK